MTQTQHGKAALRRTDIDDSDFTTRLHTRASWLVQAGVPLSVLHAEMGGWESVEMVK